MTTLQAASRSETDRVVGRRLQDDVHGLARAVARRVGRGDGSLLLDPARRARLIQDAAACIRHLAAALTTGRPALLDEYIRWAASVTAEGARPAVVAVLEALADEVGVHLEAEELAAVAPLLARARDLAAEPAVEPDALLDPETPLGRLGTQLLDLLLAGARGEAVALVLAAADDGVPIEALYLDVFQPCLWEVGRRWQLGTVSVTQEHFVTAAIQLIMAQLYPRLFATPRTGRRVVVASVGGELHELGGRMVADLFELRGWDTRFVGANTPADDIAGLAADTGADVVAISATLPTHVPEVEAVVAAVRARSQAAILVGGRPFNRVPDLWQVVGADATAPDALAAVEVATAQVATTPGR